jgi:glutamyl-Q tRNA(Asp) synthetase
MVPVGRFAPSPTGPLHLGSLVAAVGSWLFARSQGGRWLLRMEDLDTPRIVPGMADDILRTLEQLGLEWDGPVVWQSQRKDAYESACLDLLTKGLLYPCGCSRADLARSASAPHPGEDGPAYPGTCQDGVKEGRGERSFRVRVTDEEIVFSDGVMGDYRQNLLAACGDFVIRRKDGPYAYQLAVVVDDAAMGVNQVVRGADLISSTPRQIHLQRLLGLLTPRYAHLPLVTGPDHAKLSKRDNTVSLSYDLDLATHGSRLISASLEFLGQPVPPELAASSCGELLEWGRTYFDEMQVPRKSGPLLISYEMGH